MVDNYRRHLDPTCGALEGKCPFQASEGLGAPWWVCVCVGGGGGILKRGFQTGFKKARRLMVYDVPPHLEIDSG